jgi:Ca2+-transporting ATPase
MPAERTPAPPYPHAESAEAVIARYAVDSERGLDQADVADRQARLGANQLQETPPPPKWRRFLGQVLKPIVIIVIGAAAISGLLEDASETLAILAIVLLNGIIGLIQEDRAERALGPTAAVGSPGQGPAGGPAPADPRQRPRARQSDHPEGRRPRPGRC